MNGDPAACCAHAGHVSPRQGGTIGDVFRWAEHSGEIELEVEAASEHGVYADGARAGAEPPGGAGPPQGRAPTRRVTVAAGDRPRLLAELLAELAFLAESDG